MTRTALVIGAQTHGLTGVENDVIAVGAALSSRGFTLRTCEADDASRDGILGAYEQLIADAKPDDAVVVYYSGHGGFYRPPDFGNTARPRLDMQFIVPSDFHKSAAGDFRGITSFELSHLLHELTQKTPNVTMVLDCCHAAHMARDRSLDLRVKALHHPAPYDVVAAHIDSVRRQSRVADRWSHSGNLQAVRIVACGPDQSAYEYTNQHGHRTGILTEALILALSEVGDLPATWSTVIDRVRRRVLGLLPSQRPEAEGPSRRLLFDVVEADPVATLPVVAADADRVRLDGGRLLGVHIGDEFVVMPPDSPGPDADTKVGDVRVDAFDTMAAHGPLRRRVPGSSVPLGARAHWTRASASPFPVGLPDADACSPELLAAIAASPQLRVVEPDEHRSADVRVGPGGELTVCDLVGPLHVPQSADGIGIAHVVRNLKRLAQAKTLRCLVEDAAHALPGEVSVEFGLVDGGHERPLASSGAVLFVQQHVYVKVANHGSQAVYVSLFDIGISSGITLLTSADPSGAPVDPGKEYVFGWNPYPGTLTGAPLTWPDGFDQTQARPETIVAIATSEPQDLRVFEQDGVRLAKGGQRSPLEQLFDQMAAGTTRDLASTERPTVRYAVRTIDFDLMPVGAPRDEDVSFLVDEQPEPSARLLAAKGGAATTVAVVLTDVVIHHNRALRDADIRLDAVVLTGSGTGQPVYRAQTARFNNIRDGERLPLDRMLVYHGPAVDYLDLAVWVSRDSSDSLALSDLLTETLTDTRMQQALADIGGLTVAAPQAAIAVAAVSASAIIINAAYRLLRGAVGDSIGLYRTTLLGDERFGIGRTPDLNTVRAQDFSLTYTVRDVS